MRLENLDLNLLVALDILLEEQNITRAAERLHKTQSATSGILKRLRDYFDDELLVQVGRQMQPTPYALELKEPVREVLLMIRSTILNPRSHEPTEAKRHFKIVASGYVVTVLMTRLLQSLITESPGLTFEFIAPSEEAADLLARGEVDLMVLPEQHGPRGHQAVPLLDDHFSCLVSEEHWPGKAELTLDDYVTSGHVMIAFGSHKAKGVEEDFLKSLNIRRRIEVITSDFNTLPQLVLNTRRIATLQSRLADLYAKHLPLKALSPPFEISRFREYLHWNRSYENDPLHEWLRKKIIAAAR